ncbi:MAG: AraC family transcriptional regulator, partial [Pseudomonadota bacterium]|nr:AraC family transcriptional regulator [Pseudomonadota bacterium]
MPPESKPPGVIRQVGFVLLPGFSLLAQACALEPLHVANLLAGERLYTPLTFGLDERAVKSAAELALAPHSVAGADAGELDMLIVCAPVAFNGGHDALLAWLARLAGRGVALGGIAGGTEVLARAGVLDGYRATLPWHSAESFMQAHPAVRVSQQLFEIDRDRLTCGGGTAAMDMMMTLIAQHHG